ncbi:Gmad2 immunoglobulin-like domain-containing protein [Patescibacteria group bacterium]|nr:Gmad2 immunoglobulin-like domain-containing protein [Patescibacteria group bacterium]MBU1500677.1 Gmad2 immunoglobulin-like domain-containing protein [Patescibacteria group bacterium]MBU2080770.1 Gmad2 immunoglobulin-like domain-containing protein [Patescibacteria group bacterium]MBU2123875.1 Gmad2 immunoglobulin-like domain-containing protein [Patescibacteria group bacterium]MBU2194834.1 Gmad2 immunoglobulin-like domain-containing protein [Patescibacteria group bacterium]
MMKPFLYILGAIVILAGLFFVLNTYIYNEKQADGDYIDPATVLSFEDCVAAGYPVAESNPRQCRTPDGRLYAEEIPEMITYMNATPDMISVSLPFPGAVTGKEFGVQGEARGNWFFEASFPITLLDKDGKVLATAIAQADGDWMTTEFVPFSTNIKAPESYIGPATLVLKKDNPSGLPENDASISFPITIEY